MWFGVRHQGLLGLAGSGAISRHLSVLGFPGEEQVKETKDSMRGCGICFRTWVFLYNWALEEETAVSKGAGT